MVYAHVSGSLSARSMSLLPSTVAPGTSWAIALSGAAVSAHAINTPGVRHEWLLEARSGRDIHRTSSGFDSGAVESTGSENMSCATTHRSMAAGKHGDAGSCRSAASATRIAASASTVATGGGFFIRLLCGTARTRCGLAAASPSQFGFSLDLRHTSEGAEPRRENMCCGR